MHEILFLRMTERILAVVIGGICIYLGYRLFLRIPEQKEGVAKFEFLGKVSVYMARVGPGVFFALFGTVLVGLSLYKVIQFSDGIPTATDLPPTDLNTHVTSFLGAGETVKTSDTQSPDVTRIRLRGEIAILNTILTNLRHDLPEGERYKIERAILLTKFELMKSVWDKEWGDRNAFGRWVQNGALDPVPDDLKGGAVEYFRYRGDTQ